MVTGASDFLGHFVVKELLANPNFEIIAIGGRPEMFSRKTFTISTIIFMC